MKDEHLKLDPDKTYRLVFQTNCGDFTVTLDQKASPNATGSLVSLAQRGFFDDTFFHRIVPEFVIQGGDPTGTGTGGPGYSTHDKVAPNASYKHGVVAMAKSGAEPPGTAGSQFFVVTGANAPLPPDYAVVGKVTSGLDVVDVIGGFGDATEHADALDRHQEGEGRDVVAAVVLAAGAATRFGAPKQRLFLPDVLAALRASSVEDVVVVAGAYELETDARLVECPDWERGPGASLRCGLRELDAEAVVVVLADGPGLDPRAVDRVVESWRVGAGERLAATYDGVNRSHPVLLARAAWNDVPDDGARALEVTLVACEDLRPPGDVDY